MYLIAPFRKFCDFSLKLDSGKELSVHKMVLSSTSTYFSGLFDSQMIETSQGFVELKDMKDKPALVRMTTNPKVFSPY